MIANIMIGQDPDNKFGWSHTDISDRIRDGSSVPSKNIIFRHIFRFMNHAETLFSLNIFGSSFI